MNKHYSLNKGIEKQTFGNGQTDPDNGWDNGVDLAEAEEYLRNDAPPLVKGDPKLKFFTNVIVKALRDYGISASRAAVMVYQIKKPPYEKEKFCTDVQTFYVRCTDKAGTQSLAKSPQSDFDEDTSVDDYSPFSIEDLVERTQIDSSAPFEPATLVALRELKPHDFETLRARLLDIGFDRMTALEKTINKTGKDQKRSLADALAQVADEAEYYRETDGTAYAQIVSHGVCKTLAVESSAFRNWLSKTYQKRSGRVPSETTLRDVIRAVVAKADDAPVQRTFIRMGAANGRMFIDLCNDDHEYVEVDADGWRVIKSDRLPAGVNFRRSSTMLALPTPEYGGDISELRPFLNVEPDGSQPSANDANFILIVMYVIAAFRVDVPYPILPIWGEQGSAKTTMCRTIRRLFDPALPASRTLPKSEQDLFIAAKNAHCLSFDNVSTIPDWESDAMCRISTGGGMGTRKLYSNDEEMVFNAKRPIILNGINSAMRRPDLLDRSVIITLQSIKKRMSESDFDAKFFAALPRILGALFDIAAHGLKQLPHTQPDPSAPRMSDFDLFARACETKIWKAGTFRAAYAANRSNAKERILGADPVAAALTSFMEFETRWEGTATNLLERLGAIHDPVSYDGYFPASPNALSRRLRIIAPDMREVRGLDISTDRTGKDRTREILITRRGGA